MTMGADFSIGYTTGARSDARRDDAAVGAIASWSDAIPFGRLAG